MVIKMILLTVAIRCKTNKKGLKNGIFWETFFINILFFLLVENQIFLLTKFVLYRSGIKWIILYGKPQNFCTQKFIENLLSMCKSKIDCLIREQNKLSPKRQNELSQKRRKFFPNMIKCFFLSEKMILSPLEKQVIIYQIKYTYYLNAFFQG